MAVKRVIKGVHVVPMGMSNAFLIEGDDGFPGKEAAVFGAIRGLGHSPDQLKHLIFTHGHPDHIGSAAVRETGARTYMHPLDIPMIWPKALLIDGCLSIRGSLRETNGNHFEEVCRS